MAVLGAALVVVAVTGVSAGSLLLVGLVVLCPLVMVGAMWWMSRSTAAHGAGTSAPGDASTDAELDGTRH